MRIFAVVLALVCLDGSAAAQRWVISQNLTTERVVGLLDLPEVVSAVHTGTCESPKLIKVQTYSGPSETSALMGTIFVRQHPEYGCTLLLTRAGMPTEEALPIEESEYETPAAVVYEQRGRGFRIAVQQGSAWIERAESESFLAYSVYTSAPNRCGKRSHTSSTIAITTTMPISFFMCSAGHSTVSSQARESDSA